MDSCNCVLLGPSTMVDGCWQQSSRNCLEKEEGKAPLTLFPGKGTCYLSIGIPEWGARIIGMQILSCFAHGCCSAHIAYKLYLQTKQCFASQRQCNHKIAGIGTITVPEWYIHPDRIQEALFHSHFCSHLLSLVRCVAMQLPCPNLLIQGQCNSIGIYPILVQWISKSWAKMREGKQVIAATTT